MKQSKSLIAQELGRLGGLKTLKNKGKQHFIAMAKKRWSKSYPQIELDRKSKR